MSYKINDSLLRLSNRWGRDVYVAVEDGSWGQRFVVRVRGRRGYFQLSASSYYEGVKGALAAAHQRTDDLFSAATAEAALDRLERYLEHTPDA